ncbi:hypothetical protein [Candidatus Thiosymbion oneisti]|uniref:hypothetical protein n=1 Tax=Candidatus Thiosymbion oneisti TaxID=589554 RepID=UPI00105F725B|nr:hypothetical protein [Candidatus Thiosymbion oneisti]
MAATQPTVYGPFLDSPLHFGVPRDAGDEVTVQVRWPDGTFEKRGVVRVGGYYRIRRHAELTTIRQG